MPTEYPRRGWLSFCHSSAYILRLIAQAGIIATDFSGVDIRMPIMNRHPTDQEEKAVTAVPAGATTFGAPSAGSFPVDFPEPVRRQGGGGSSPGPSGS